jgi:hypothetical protein
MLFRDAAAFESAPPDGAFLMPGVAFDNLPIGMLKARGVKDAACATGLWLLQ